MDTLNHINHRSRAARGPRISALATLAAAALLAPAIACSQAQPAALAQPQATAYAAAAPSAEAMTLATAIALAMQGNPEVAAALRQVEAAEGPLLQGRARPNPELAYSLEDSRSQTRTQSWQLNLPIELGGKRAARIQAAEKAREQSLAQLAQVRATLRADVIAAYFDVLGAQQRLALAQDSAALAASSTDAVGKRVAAGKLSPVEETKARVAQSGVRVELARAASEERSAWIRLQALWGSAGPRAATLAGQATELPAVPQWASLQSMVAASPALAVARLEVERRQALTEIERSKRVPDVTLSAGVQRANEMQRNVLLLGVSVPLPVFDRNQGNLLEALKLEDKARDELQATTLRLHSEVAQAYERLATLATEVRSLEAEVLPGAKSAYDAAGIGFENGKFSFLEVLDAQRTYFAARSQYLLALAQAHRAAAEIDRLLGSDLPAHSTTTLQ